MRKLAILAVLAAALQFGFDGIPADFFRESETHRDARLVAELRCGALSGAQRASCEADLHERFASGQAQPGTWLRSHCTRFSGSWSATPAPPEICVQRFGGWIPATDAAAPAHVAAAPPYR